MIKTYVQFVIKMFKGSYSFCMNIVHVNNGVLALLLLSRQYAYMVYGPSML